MKNIHTEIDAPSEWVTRFAPLVPSHGAVLDVACGGGRHAAYFAARGHPVTAVDREPLATAIERVRFVEADLEGAPWPFAGQQFAAVVVTNYLHRALLPALVAAVADGGLLIYETFALGNEQYGRPTRADFLLKPNELLEAVRSQLSVVAFEDVTVARPKPARVQRIVAGRSLRGAPIG